MGIKNLSCIMGLMHVMFWHTLQMWYTISPFLCQVTRRLIQLCRLILFFSDFQGSLANMSTISPTDFDSVEIQQQYNDINNRWDIAAETEWDNENSSARLFERSRIKALAGQITVLCVLSCACSWRILCQFSTGGVVFVSSRGWYRAIHNFWTEIFLGE